MLSNKDIELILGSVKAEWSEVSEKDIIFAILYNTLEDKNKAYKYAYRTTRGSGEKHYNEPKFKTLINALEPFGIGGISEYTITKEENKEGLLKLLYSIDDMLKSKQIQPKDAVKMKADIHVKLNDKFNIEDNQKQKRIIVVPQKHDCICPHTQYECSYWPSKETCIKHYDIKVKED